jgi:hypothetical protein
MGGGVYITTQYLIPEHFHLLTTQKLWAHQQSFSILH